MRKYITLYETAKRCVLILDHLFYDFTEGTRVLSQPNHVQPNEAIIIRLYISALGLIDYFHSRARGRATLKLDSPRKVWSELLALEP